MQPYPGMIRTVAIKDQRLRVSHFSVANIDIQTSIEEATLIFSPVVHRLKLLHYHCRLQLQTSTFVVFFVVVFVFFIFVECSCFYHSMESTLLESSSATETTANLLHLEEKAPVVVDLDTTTASLNIFLTKEENEEETKRQSECNSHTSGSDTSDDDNDDDSKVSDSSSSNNKEQQQQQQQQGTTQSTTPVTSVFTNTTAKLSELKVSPDVKTDIFTELLQAVPFEKDDLDIILAGARLGLLHETLALRAIVRAIPNNDDNNNNDNNMKKNSSIPNVIRHIKDDSEKTGIRIRKFYREALEGDQYSLLLANLSAYMFWDYTWFSKRQYTAKMKYERLCKTQNATKTTTTTAQTFSPSLSAPLKPTGVEGGSCFTATTAKKKQSGRHDYNVWDWTPDVHHDHNEWCRKSGINPVRVRLISKTIHTTLQVLFQSKFESKCEWLRCTHAIPLWRKIDKWNGRNNSISHCDMVFQVYGKVNGPLLCQSLRALCEHRSALSNNLKSCGKIVMPALEMMASSTAWKDCPVKTPQEVGESDLRIVKFFRSKGKRIMGNRTVKAAVKRSTAVAKTVVGHGNGVKRPQSSLYEPGTVKKMQSELAHWFKEAPDTPLYMAINRNAQRKSAAPEEHQDTELEIFQAIAPILSSMKIASGPSWWIRRNAKTLLLIGDGNFDFAKALGFMGYRPKYATTLETRTSKNQPSERGRLRCIDATRIHRNYRIQSAALNGEVDTFAWNFPHLDDKKDATNEDHEALLLGTFYSLGLLYDSLCDVDALAVLLRPFQFGITLHDDQFSKWSVLRSAERGGWRLKSWDNFDTQAFPGYRPSTSTGEPYPAKYARFYVFEYVEGYLDVMCPNLDGRMY